MKYLCLAYEAEDSFTAMPAHEWAALREETLDYVERLRSAGKLLATHALQGAGTASKVSVRGARVIVTDGPFAETKEQIGGYFLLEVTDRAEAEAIAAQWPGARIGTIEVRPVEEMLRIEGRY